MNVGLINYNMCSEQMCWRASRPVGPARFSAVYPWGPSPGFSVMGGVRRPREAAPVSDDADIAEEAAGAEKDLRFIARYFDLPAPVRAHVRKYVRALHEAGYGPRAPQKNRPC